MKIFDKLSDNGQRAVAIIFIFFIYIAALYLSFTYLYSISIYICIIIVSVLPAGLISCFYKHAEEIYSRYSFGKCIENHSECLLRRQLYKIKYYYIIMKAIWKTFDKTSKLAFSVMLFIYLVVVMYLGGIKGLLGLLGASTFLIGILNKINKRIIEKVSKFLVWFMEPDQRKIVINILFSQAERLQAIQVLANTAEAELIQLSAILNQLPQAEQLEVITRHLAYIHA